MYSAAEAEIESLKDAHKKEIDKAKKEVTKFKAKYLAATKKGSKPTESDIAEARASLNAEEELENLRSENEKLHLQLEALKPRHIGHVR